MVTALRGPGALVALALALAPVDRARADDAVDAALVRARAQRAALRYRDALVAVEAALARGRASPAQVAELYRLAGELAAGLDEPSAAQGWFARWLALAPRSQLPADASPKLRVPFDAARARLGGRALAVSVTAAAGGRAVTISVDGDALGLVRRVRVRAADPAASAPAQDGLPGATLTIPAAAGVAVALDEHGNELVIVPLAPVTAAGGRGPRPGPAPHARWQLWAGAAAGLAAGGGAFAWRLDVAQDEFDRLRRDSASHTLAELEAVATRGRRHAVAANLAFGAATVTAVVAVVLAVRGSGDDDGDRAPGALMVGPALAPGHAGVALTGRF